ncbi:MAG: D-alanyl-D-alanine carboxypeptidase/D-alanyl-D-alanine-endopeptidase [Actinobacteria bacterium]|nr:D-alanyl-D-alanine carboxypeptidase/D-alanyl-D-alanine-endopeptidase [Actinomycetota bacterium]
MSRRFRIVISTLSTTVLLASGLVLADGAAAADGLKSKTDPELSVTAGMRGTADLYRPDLQSLGGGTARSLVPTAVANQRITRKLPRRSTSPAIGRNYGVQVVDIESGANVWSRKAKRSLLPASNMKIATAVTALHTMGPEKRFTTKVVSLGQGKVAVVGGGDATLSRRGLTKLAKRTATALRAAPELLSNSKLKVYVDDSYYPAPSRPRGYRSGYEPGVVRPVRALGMDGSYVWDSSKTAADYFRSVLLRKGLASKYKGHASGAGGQELATYSGARLADQVRYMLQVSENNIAEMLYRNVAIARGYRATWRKSRKAATQILTEMGVPMRSTYLSSGSGVSRTDRLTPRALVAMLQRVADKDSYPDLESIYYGGGLPLAGVSGTLSAQTGRFNTRPTNCAAGRLRAKTGTLFDTIGLSGIATGSDGKLKAFAVLVNSRPQRVSPLQTRRKVDRIPATITGCY